MLQNGNNDLFGFKCIVDKSPQIIGTRVGSLEIQKPAKEVFEGIDAIVVPNSNYIDSVIDDLTVMGCDIPVIDIVAFYRFGIPLRECIYREQCFDFGGQKSKQRNVHE